MRFSQVIRCDGLPSRTVIAAAFLLAGFASCGEAGSVEPWDGTLQSGVQAMSEEAEAGRIDAALAVADRMLSPGATARLREGLNGATRGVSESVLSPITSVLDLLGVSALRPSDRAEIEYARAATLLAGAARGEEDAPGFLERAETALERARGAAPGDVRKSAVYNQGTLDLMAAEAVRATIPEIAGQGGAGPQSPPDPNQDEDAPDPLDVARALYLQARSHFVEYLTDHEGEDASANVELVIRRLRELDEIEKQREEQQQESSDEGEEGEEGDENQEQQDENDQSQEKQDGDPSEDESSSDEQGDEDSEGEPDDPSEEESEEQPEDEQEPEEGEEGEPEGEPEGDPEEQPEPGEEKIEETTMTLEEFQRLLEQNRKHQELGEEIRRARTLRGKIPAKKDW